MNNSMISMRRLPFRFGAPMSLVAPISLAVLGMLAACGAQQSEQPPHAPEVAVQTARQTSVPLDLVYTARTVGSREVDVRARVGGILLKRRYQEGSAVSAGQPMFLIDPEPVRARLASAQAAVAVAIARLDEAHRQRDRILQLLEQKLVSQSQRDEAVSAFEVAQANLQAAQSSVRTAELDLEYTDVRAPISGLTSREVLSEGSLVSTDQNSSPLTRIVQVQPLYVEFSAPQGEAQLIRDNMAANGKTRATGATNLGVALLLEDGSEHSERAQLTFIDNAVDMQSGTVRIRAVLRNPDTKLLPGQFIRARVDGVTLASAVAIPRKAVMTSAQSHFVWIVGAEQKVEMRPVTLGANLGGNLGNDVVILQGLNPGDRYIVEGVLKVQPGIAVNAVSLDKNAADTPARQAETAAQPKEAA